MSERLIQLAEHRATLIARAGSQREVLAQSANRWRKPLAVVDKGVAAVHYLRQHPPLLFGISATVAVLRPRAAFRWARRSLVVWRLARSVKHKLGI